MAGCGKKQGSSSFLAESVTATIDALKDTLPSKGNYQVHAAVGTVSSALATLPGYVPSAAGKAKAQKAIDLYEKDVRVTIETLQYDTAAMCKKLDEIRAIVVEVGKEIK
jgi:hypothetical protein